MSFKSSAIKTTIVKVEILKCGMIILHEFWNSMHLEFFFFVCFPFSVPKQQDFAIYLKGSYSRQPAAKA